MLDGRLGGWSLGGGCCLRGTSSHTTASFSGTESIGIDVITEDRKYSIHALALAFLQHLTLTLSGLQLVAQWWLLLLAILFRLLILLFFGCLRRCGGRMLLVFGGLRRTVVYSSRFGCCGSAGGGSSGRRGRTGTLGGSRFFGQRLVGLQVAHMFYVKVKCS